MGTDSESVYYFQLTLYDPGSVIWFLAKLYKNVRYSGSFLVVR